MSFYWKFVDTLVYNVATIAGFIVGICQFLIRAFNENDGANKVRKGVNQTMLFVNKVSSSAYEKTKVEVTKPRTRSRKRVAA